MVRAEAPLDRISKAHAAEDTPPHLFRGQSARFRQFAEITLGSYVANLLAEAAALFALQDYGRVLNT